MMPKNDDPLPAFVGDMRAPDFTGVEGDLMVHKKLQEEGAADSYRRRPVEPPDVAAIRENLAAHATEAKRLRRILDSGATEQEPLVYDTRAPNGCRLLLEWGCIDVRNVEGAVHVWPLPLGQEVLSREVAGRRNEP